jgi:DNA-binding NarL/FixJ family response regulator
MPEPIRILIADDHPVVRTGLRGMLATPEEFVIVGEAENGEEALRLTGERRPDIVLMDLRMPVLDGLQATICIKQQYPLTQILILTTYDSDRDIVTAIQAGAIGYLLKDAPREDLYQAIRAAAKGKSALNPDIAARLMEHVRRPVSEDQLSERETEILQLVSEGLTNKQIGAQLHISEATVKTHLIHVFAKLNVADRAAAVRIAIERGILQLR